MDNGIENKQRMNRTEVNSFNQFLPSRYTTERPQLLPLQ